MAYMHVDSLYEKFCAGTLPSNAEDILMSCLELAERGYKMPSPMRYRDMHPLENRFVKFSSHYDEVHCHQEYQQLSDLLTGPVMGSKTLASVNDPMIRAHGLFLFSVIQLHRGELLITGFELFICYLVLFFNCLWKCILIGFYFLLCFGCVKVGLMDNLCFCFRMDAVLVFFFVCD